MIDLDVLVAECEAALAESQPMLAVKEILERVVAEPDAVTEALRPEPGATVLHRSSALTIVNVVVPTGLPETPPHDHRMWAVVGIYGGQEDNRFFRRVDTRLTDSGGRSLAVGDTLVMGDNTIHAIRNPLDHSTLAAIHIYGGDLVGAQRSMWTGPDLEEEPYDEKKVVGRFTEPQPPLPAQ